MLLPGSKTDKGWMESGYDGLVAAQKRHGAKIKVQMIENISNADMEQALTTLAQKNKLVIGIGGQTQAALMKVAKRFPKVNFAVIGGNRDESLPNVSGYDVKQAEIAYVAGAAAAMLSKTGAMSYVGGLEIPPIVNAGTEFNNGAKSINPNIKFFVNYTGDFDDVAKSKEATLAAIAQGADVHYHILNLGLRGMEQAAKDKSTQDHRQLHRPLRQRSALHRLQHHRRRLPDRVRDQTSRWPAPGRRATSRSAWRWDRRPPA